MLIMSPQLFRLEIMSSEDISLTLYHHEQTLDKAKKGRGNIYFADSFSPLYIVALEKRQRECRISSLPPPLLFYLTHGIVLQHFR